MSELDKLNDIINIKVAGSRQAQLRFVECKSVQWDDRGHRTMTAVGLTDDTKYLEVMLGFGYTDIKPKQGSVCLIGVVEGQEALTFLINAEEVELVEVKADKIEYNDKANDSGLAIVPELRRQLDTMTKRIDGIISAIKGGIPVAQDGGTALQKSIVAALDTITDKEDFSNIENKQIMH